jgi:hypothetical protein
LATLRSNGTPR